MLLSDEDRNRLIALLKRRESIKYSEGLRAQVLLSVHDGLSYVDISKVLRISIGSISKYVQEYEDSKKTRGDKRGGSISKLSDSQKKDLSFHLEEKTYLKVSEIKQYILDNYNVSYSKSGVCKLLEELGFEYKRPRKCPAKLDSAAQEGFKERYHELKDNLKEDEVILFIDSVHPDHQTQNVHGWIKKGVQKSVPTTAKQKRLHYSGAVELGKSEVRLEVESFAKINSDTTVNFMEHLVAKYAEKKKIYIILDQAGYHKGNLVKDFVDKMKGKVELVYLPPYSPNLNPIERCWKIMREHVTYNKYYASFADFEQAVRKFFTETLPNIPEILRARITDNFQVINPNFVQV